MRVKLAWCQPHDREPLYQKKHLGSGWHLLGDRKEEGKLRKIRLTQQNIMAAWRDSYLLIFLFKTTHFVIFFRVFRSLNN